MGFTLNETIVNDITDPTEPDIRRAFQRKYLTSGSSEMAQAGRYIELHEQPEGETLRAWTEWGSDDYKITYFRKNESGDIQPVTLTEDRRVSQDDAIGVFLRHLQGDGSWADTYEWEPWTLPKCFIATACCGSPDCHEVLTLCRFRDECLESTVAGRMLVRAYYKVSPPIARALSMMPRLRAMTRWVILHCVIPIVPTCGEQ